MTIELLNVEKARQIIDENGWRIGWVRKKIGAKWTEGNALLADGHLPKDPARKKELLGKLSKLLGVPAKDLVVTLEARAS